MSGPDFARAGRDGSGGDNLATTVQKALLPTPRAGDGEKGGPNQRGSSGDLMLPSAVHHLLPTPNATDKQRSQTVEQRESEGRQVRISDVANTLAQQAEQRLLPTPVCTDAKGARRSTARTDAWSSHDGETLTDAALKMLPTPTTNDARNTGAGGTSQLDRKSPGLNAEVTLLPTPAVNDMGEGKSVEWWDEWAPRQKAADGTPAPHGKSLAIEAQRLLPSPNAALGGGGQTSRSGDRADEALLGGIDRLLPTPTLPHPAQDTRDAQKRAESTHQTELGDVVRLEQTWGDYAPAIRRWEIVTGRPAPAPTEWSEIFRRRQAGRDKRPVGMRGSLRGLRRLSPVFVEWMMGLPAGHVTDPRIGITRNDMLKALGNGVVWQQAAAALSDMLSSAVEDEDRVA